MALPERPLRRLLVALDARPDYRQPLQRSAELARVLDAELGVLFIEDASLFHLCELPTAEIALGTRRWRRVESGNLERELRARAAEARASLEQVASVSHLSWSFEVWRGHAAEGVREAARRAELVTLAWAPRPLLAPPRRASPARAHLGPVVVLYEADVSDRVLDVAANLARAMARPLQVLLIGDAPSRAVDAGPADKASVKRIPAEPEAILQAVDGLDAELLVLPAEDADLPSISLADLIDRSGAQALLVRDVAHGED